MLDNDSDDLVFADDEVSAAAATDPWQVLIVDDDPEVHAATRFVLRGQRLLGRPVQLHSAHSAAEAQASLARLTGIAVVLLDVVMERPDAGLTLVHTIRQTLGLHELRIILRTGQPGYAPEMDVIARYDINDYRTKGELTQTRLLTSLTSALRGYEQIRRIEASRRGLGQIIHASRDLLTSRGLQRFASGVLAQLSSFLGMNDQRGLVVIGPSGPMGGVGQSAPSVPSGPDAPVAPGAPDAHPQAPADAGLKVVAASGPYTALVNRPLDDIGDASLRDQLREALAQRRNVYGSHGCALYCNSLRHHLAVFIDTSGDIDPDLRELLTVFTENIALCSDNLSLIEQAREAAYTDALTGLPSRVKLLQHLGQPAAPDAALLMLDIDDFNAQVETLGPEQSDRLLCQMADRLRDLAGDGALMPARVAADVFALFGPRDRLGPTCLAALCAAPFDADGVPIQLALCGGLAAVADAPASAAQLMAAAYLALKRAKREPLTGHVAYQPAMGSAALRRSKLLHAMHASLQTDGFALALQPQLRASDGAVVGVEALLRWSRGDLPPIGPDEFIPLAESAGLIRPLGAWVIDEACRQAAELTRRTGHRLRVAVNVSPAQWRDPSLAEQLLQAVARHGLAPQQLEIELTETLAMREIDTLLDRLHHLRAHGIRVALDDFGTGFSSLAYLQHMPIDQLKIDRSFIHQIAPDGRGEAITRTIVRLGAVLGLEVLAEGVETEAQLQAVRALGCDTVQGYLHGRPMPLEALCQWLAGRPVAGTTPAATA